MQIDGSTETTFLICVPFVHFVYGVSLEECHATLTHLTPRHTYLRHMKYI